MVSISRPVGKVPMGTPNANLPQDVRTIQKLLNAQMAKLMPMTALGEDGVIGPKTIAAIEEFQRRVVGMSQPDGRVDPGGATLKALGGTATVATVPGAAGQVTGKTAGVNADIIKYLNAVATHYGKTINVTSGKRSASEQADAMWGGWSQHLERGKIYSYLQQNETVRKELDGFYNLAHSATASAASKTKARQDFNAKVISIAGGLSRHLTGEAVDVSLSTDTKVLCALKVGFTYIEEKYQGVVKCHHFDIRKFGKAPNVDDTIRSQWPK